MPLRFERVRPATSIGADDREPPNAASFGAIGVLATSILALVLASCSPRPSAKPNVEPFNFEVALGSSKYQIVGYLALTPELGRWPALLVLNGGKGDARHCIDRSTEFTEMGIQVACICIPGYGGSSGPSRFVGPQSVEVARRALDLLAQRPEVDPARLAVWGLSQGAMAAGLLMDSDTRLRAVILQSGAYDLVSLWPSAPLETKLKILREVWPSRRVLEERSVIAHLPARLDCSVLILHGERDKQVPLGQAQLLARALREHGAKVETRYFPMAAHDLGNRVRPPLRKFLRENLLAYNTDAKS